MTITVKTPDGGTASFPDGTPPDQITAVMRQKFGGPDPAQQQAQPQAPATAPAGTTPAGGMDMSGVMGQLYAAAHGLEDTASFGLADRVIAAPVAAARTLMGDPTSYDEAYANIKQRAADATDAHPITTLAGDAAGLLTGGGLLAKGVEAAGKAIPAVARAAEALAPKSAATIGRALTTGEKVGNIAKAAVIGGGVSAADTAGHGGDEDQILNSTALGAVAGPVLSKAGQLAVKAVRGPVDKGMALLADKLGEPISVLQNAFDNFRTSTGQIPTLAQIVGLKSQGELRLVAAGNPTVGELANQAAAESRATLPADLTRQVTTAVGQPDNISTLMQTRSANMTQAMDPIRNQPVPLTSRDAALLQDPRIRAATTPTPGLRNRVNDVVDNLAQHPAGVDSTLTVNDIETLRQGLRDRQGAFATAGRAGAARDVGELADNITDMARSAHPGYETALSGYENDSHFINAFEHGAAGREITDASDNGLIRSLNTQQGRMGYRSGVISRMVGRTNASEGSAANAADLLSGENATTQNLRTAVGTNNTDRLQDSANALRSGNESLQNIAPTNITPASEGVTSSDIAHGAAAAVLHSPAAVTYQLSKVLKKAGVIMSPEVQRVVGRYLFDPQMTQQGINLLRKARVDERDIKALTTGIAAATGIGASRLEGQ